MCVYRCSLGEVRSQIAKGVPTRRFVLDSAMNVATATEASPNREPCLCAHGLRQASISFARQRVASYAVGRARSMLTPTRPGLHPLVGRIFAWRPCPAPYAATCSMRTAFMPLGTRRAFWRSLSRNTAGILRKEQAMARKNQDRALRQAAERAAEAAAEEEATKHPEPLPVAGISDVSDPAAEGLASSVVVAPVVQITPV